MHLTYQNLSLTELLATAFDLKITFLVMEQATKEVWAIIESSLNRSFSREAYDELLMGYATSGKTTGPKQHEDLVYYTKLNAQRSKRVGKTFLLNESLAEAIRRISEKQTWILITESWCGDAANSVPVIAELASLNTEIDLKVVLRDEHPSLMDHFLTRGGRSIPKLIVTARNKVLYTWGPRPEEAQIMYDGWRNAEDKAPYKEFQVELQKWYNADKGQSLQHELLALISR